MKRLTDPKSKKLKLSSLLQPLTSSDSKISLANRQISLLDSVPSRFHSIKIIYLSQNFISDITMITQFPLVKVLSLSYNEIKSFKSIGVLERLKELQVLNMVGNPICRNLVYQCLVIGWCGEKLEKFDGNDVKESQLSNFREKRKQINQKFEQLHNNYITIVQLYSSLGSNYEEKQFDVVWEFLYNDCLQIYNSNKQREVEDKEEGFLEAMGEMEKRQLEKIEELEANVKESQQKLFKENRNDQYQQEEYYQEILEKQCEGINKILDIVYGKMLLGFESLIQFFTHLKTKQFTTKSPTIQKSRLSSLTSHLERVISPQKQYSPQQTSLAFYIIKTKRQQRVLKKKILQIWKNKYQAYQISKQTQFICNKLNQYKQKQSKYIQKIELLEQLVQINKNKRKSLSGFETKDSQREIGKDINKENTPGRMNSSRIVRQRSAVKLVEERCESLIRRRLMGERSG